MRKQAPGISKTRRGKVMLHARLRRRYTVDPASAHASRSPPDYSGRVQAFLACTEVDQPFSIESLTAARIARLSQKSRVV